MKKWLLLLVSLALALVPAALAEEFSIRDVRFGMTPSEVQATEGSEGKTSRNGEKVIYVPDELEGVRIGRAASDVLLYRFRFGALCAIQFWSGYYETEAEAQAAFDTWQEMIETRYGDCIDAAEPDRETSCLQFYRENTNDFAGRCLRLRRIGLTVDGERIAVDLFLLPSMDDFQTFCAFERLAP